MEYASEIWLPGKNLPEFETVHLSFMKYALGVKSQTSSVALYGETARFPLFMRQNDKAVKLWFRLKFSESDKPINQVFKELENMQNLGYHTWLTKIYNIFETLYGDISEVADPKLKLIQLRDSRHKKFVETWLSDINNHETNPKLRTYALFKNAFTKEP